MTNRVVEGRTRDSRGPALGWGRASALQASPPNLSGPRPRIGIRDMLSLERRIWWPLAGDKPPRYIPLTHTPQLAHS